MKPQSDIESAANNQRLRRSSSILRMILSVIMLSSATMLTAQEPNEAYEQGQQELRARNWERAIESFERAARERADLRDATLYWQAYALKQAGRAQEAQSRVRELERRYPQSAWIDDARALTVRGEQAIENGDGRDDELRLYALSQLMDRDPERAMPYLMRMIENASTDRTRRDALFILGVSGAPQAQQALLRIARDTADPALQRQAIQVVGVSHANAAVLLEELYANAADDSVKVAIVQAAMTTESTDFLLEVVRHDPSSEVRSRAIQALGAAGSATELKGFYAEIDDVPTRTAVLQALAIAGDIDGLAEVIANESIPALRAEAIRSIGMLDQDGRASELLRDVYENSQHEQDRRAVIDALPMLNNADVLALSIAERESDPSLQQQAIQALGIMGATEALRTMYGNAASDQTKEAVIQSLAIAGDAEGLASIMERESKPELRRRVIESSVMLSDQDEVVQSFQGMYDDADRTEREAVINAFMVMSRVEELIAILKTESDPDLRRRILQTLALVDNDAADEYLFQLLEESE